MLAVFIAGPTRARDAQVGYVHQGWTIEDGLPVNGIKKLIQPSDGYLWMATFDGLVRFDGVRFVIYNIGNTDGLPSNRIIDLVEAHDGSLWMMTEQRHVVRHDSGVFKTFGPADGLADPALVIHADTHGAVWIGTENGLYQFEGGVFVPFGEIPLDLPVVEILPASDGAVWVGVRRDGARRLKEGQITEFRKSDGLLSNLVEAFHEDDDGTIWIGSEGGVNRYRDGRLETLGLDDLMSGRSAPVIGFFQARDSNDLWIDTSREVLRFNYDDGVVHKIPGSDGAMRNKNSIAADSNGDVWFYLGGRVHCNGEVVHEFPPDEQLLEVHTVLSDREGSLWIATGNQGLHRLAESVFTVYGKPEGMKSSNIYSILQDRSGAIWLGTWGQGVTRIDGDGISNTSNTGLVRTLCEDPLGHLWVGTHYGVSTVQVVNDSLHLVPGHIPVYGPVHAIYRDRFDTMWVGAERGLYQVRGDSVTQLTGLDGVPASYTRVFTETRDGALWMGTSGAGLERYRDGRFESFTEADGLSSNLIRAIHEDQDGYLWVGTEGRGLCRLDRHGSDDLAAITVTTYRQRHGMFDEVIHQILEDDFGRLWMSSNRGIFWVTRQQLNEFAEGRRERVHSTSYTERDGMRNREANGGVQSAGIRSADGRLWWPTQGGAVVVDPERIRRNKVPPPVVIEGVSASNGSVDAADAVQLRANQRDFSIAYTALSFMEPENVRFRYRLQGFNEDWTDAVGRRTAFYTNVPAGRYRFEVIASNNDGVWNENGASIAVTIAPRFVETWWFVALMTVLVLMTVATVHIWRTRVHEARERKLKAVVAARTQDLEQEKEATEKERLRADEQRLAAEHLREAAEQARAIVEAQAEKLKTLDAAKSHFFANVSHEFRTPLTLTIGPLEDLLKDEHSPLPDQVQDELELALRNARRLLHLVNQILDVAKLESGQLRLRAERTDLAALLENVALAFSSHAERMQVEFQVEIPAEPLWVYCEVDLIEKVFTNLLSNAFKFTPEGGTVLLRCDEREAGAAADEIVLVVRDSGPGIPAAKLPHIFERFFQVDESSSRWQPGTGIGLSLARELVELHGGGISVTSEEGVGSSFAVTLKTGTSHLKPGDIAKTPSARAAASVLGYGLSAEVGAEASLESADREEDDITTVLVVDDNADIREYIRKRLEPGYRVIEATDGVEGLDATRRQLPDLVISDVMMPNMDGHAFCEALKKDADLDYIPVILLTAKATTRETIDGLALGADDYVTKPFNVDELRARVANLVASRQHLRERFSGGRLTVHASAAVVTSDTDAFLEHLREAVEAGMGDEDFTVDRLAGLAGMSRGHLHRRLRDLIGETPTDLIKRIRLERAKQLLAGGAGNVSEVAYGVGFKSVSHFSKCFREQAGMTPTRYIAQSSVDK